MLAGAILHASAVLPEPVLPGAHVIVLVQDARAFSSYRYLQGWILRDSLMIIEPGRCRCAHLLRAPLDAPTLAANALQHGVGGLHIDACRVRWQSEADREAGKPGSMPGEQDKIFHTVDRSHLNPEEKQNTIGRWPANLAFIHSPSCRIIGATSAPAPQINRYDGLRFCVEGSGAYTSTGGGTEEVPVWECAPDCPLHALDDQSGITRSPTAPTVRDKPSTFSAAATVSVSQPYGDVGGASRYYPQFANEKALIAWFTNLLTPPDGGTVFCAL
jgi:hypothetical protein